MKNDIDVLLETLAAPPLQQSHRLRSRNDAIAHTTRVNACNALFEPKTASHNVQL